MLYIAFYPGKKSFVLIHTIGLLIFNLINTECLNKSFIRFQRAKESIRSRYFSDIAKHITDLRGRRNLRGRLVNKEVF